MKRFFSSLALLLAASTAYPAGFGVTSDHLGTPPDKVTASVNGALLANCPINLASVPVTSSCDVTPFLTKAGVYTIITTASKAPTCTNTADAATCTGGGTASSSPFSLTWAPAAVSSQGLRLTVFP